MLRNTLRILFIWVTFMINVTTVKCQDISMEQTLNYINSKMGHGYSIDVLHGVIVAKFFEGTEPFREDQVMCKSLDLNSMRYDAEQKLFLINCNGGTKCVDRQLFIRKIQRDYARFSLPMTLDAKGVEGMKKAFTHMIRMVLDTKYKSSEPFE
ncbi:MAG: hypothetical protein IPP71_21595 [Bacteroidetes bacterium]|nr:hypothetical protein [Bacteroidota bacterium]